MHLNVLLTYPINSDLISIMLRKKGLFSYLMLHYFHKLMPNCCCLFGAEQVVYGGFLEDIFDLCLSGLVDVLLLDR